MSQATSAAEITDQSQSKVGSPTNTPVRAINVIAVIKITQRFFTFIMLLLVCHNDLFVLQLCDRCCPSNHAAKLHHFEM
jgi:hypothetical protein